MTNPSSSGSSSRAEAREQLQAWLRLFAAVEAPSSTLHEAARLHDECATLLGHAEPAVQALALDCLVRWGEPALLAHEGTEIIARSSEIGHANPR